MVQRANQEHRLVKRIETVTVDEGFYAGDEAEGVPPITAKMNLSVPLGTLLEWTRTIKAAITRQELADALEPFIRFTLVEWNLLDVEGQRVPPTWEGLLAQPAGDDIGIVLFNAYGRALNAPPLPRSGPAVPGATPASESGLPSGTSSPPSIPSVSDTTPSPPQS